MGKKQCNCKVPNITHKGTWKRHKVFVRVFLVRLELVKNVLVFLIVLNIFYWYTSNSLFSANLYIYQCLQFQTNKIVLCKYKQIDLVLHALFLNLNVEQREQGKVEYTLYNYYFQKRTENIYLHLSVTRAKSSRKPNRFSQNSLKPASLSYSTYNIQHQSSYLSIISAFTLYFRQSPRR